MAKVDATLKTLGLFFELSINRPNRKNLSNKDIVTWQHHFAKSKKDGVDSEQWPIIREGVCCNKVFDMLCCAQSLESKEPSQISNISYLHFSF